MNEAAMKRKGSKPGGENTKKKKVDEGDSKLSMLSPKDCLKSLIAPFDVDQFFSLHWEKKFLHVKREDNGYYGDIFDLEDVYNILKNEEVKYETEINLCKYVDGEKQMLNGEDVASSKDVKKKVEEEKATIQFHQPQRFVDILWNTMENLERYFGCIFGSNCYITPPGSQGLAPHCDDVEIFILQLSGKKAWKLYKPIDELSRHYSPDLEQKEIGDPIAEITLEKGDLLYFPRGTIHQCTTVGDSHSTHLTLSTYQNNSVGDLLSAAIKHCLDEAIDNDVEFRHGLPINFLSFLGTGRHVDSYIDRSEENDDQKSNGKKSESEDKGNNDGRIVDLKRKMKSLLEKLADHLDLHVAADSLSEDFMASRLPPYVCDNEDEEVESTPTLESGIKIKHPDHVRLIIYSDDDSDEEDDDEDSIIEADEVKEEEEEAPSKKEDTKKSGKKGRPKTRSNSGTKSPKSQKQKKKPVEEEMEGVESEDEEGLDEDSTGPHVTILHSCSNNRKSHMVGEIHEVGIRLPLHFANAIQFVMENCDKFVKVKDFPLLDENDKIKLAVNLWSEGLIEVQ